MYPAAMLKNTKTGKFHPIIFRAAPMPSGSAPRYKSLGHHTKGFDTLEAAKEWVQEMVKQGKLIDHTDQIAEWDGVGVPAMVTFFA